VSGHAVTLLVLFFLASSGIFDTRPLDSASRALCMAGMSEEAPRLAAQGQDCSHEATRAAPIREPGPGGPLASCCQIGRGLPAPRAPDRC